MTTPATPNNFTVVADLHTSQIGTGFLLSWDAETPAIQLTVVSSADNGSGLVRLTLGGNHGFTGAQVGDEVIIRDHGVSALNARHIIQAIPSATQIDLTTLYTASGTAGKVTRTSGHYGYRIEHADSGAGPWTKIYEKNADDVAEVAGIFVTAVSFQHLLRPPGVNHSYRVFAVDYDGDLSAASATASATRTAKPGPFPTDVLSAIRDSTTQATVSWTTTDSTARRWELERTGDGGATWTRVYYSTTNEVRTGYVDTTLVDGVFYQYRLRSRIVLHSVTPTGAAWQNQDDPMDVNDDGDVDWKDFRVLVAFTEDLWPDFGISRQFPSGGAGPPNVAPATDPVQVHPTYFPNGAYVDVSGDNVVTPFDRLLLQTHFQNTAAYKGRSAWSNIADAADPPDAWWLYLADPSFSRVARFWNDGKNLEDLTTRGTATGTMRAVAVDKARGELYWIGGGLPHGTIYKSSIHSGAAPTVVHTGEGHLGIAVDSTNGKLYWCNEAEVKRSNLDGSNVELLVDVGDIADLGTFVDITVAPASDFIFWTDHSMRRVYRAALDGTSVSTIRTEASPVTMWGVHYDLGEDKVFYTTGPVEQSVKSIETDGSSPTVVASSEVNPLAIAVDDVNDRLIWSGGDLGDMYVRSSDLDGAAKSTLLANCNNDIYGLAAISQGAQPDTAPSGFTAVLLNPTTVRVSWYNSTTPADHDAIEIHRATVNEECAFRFLATIDTTGGTGHYDDSINSSSTYYYRVRSVNSQITPNPAADWQHPVHIYDIDDDGIIGQSDLEAILDDLTANGARTLPLPRGAGEPYLDVTGDGRATNLDLAHYTARLSVWLTSGPQSFWTATATVNSGTTTTTSTTTSTSTSTSTTTSTSTSTSTSTTTSTPPPCRDLYFITHDGGESPQSRLRGIDTDGSNDTTIVSSGTGAFGGHTAEAVPDHGRIFYTDLAVVGLQQRLMAYSVFSSTSSEVRQLSTSHLVKDIETDPAVSKVFYAIDKELRVVPYDGATDTLIYTATGQIANLAIDPCRKRIYWTESGNHLHRARYDGTDHEVVVNGDFDGIDIDPEFNGGIIAASNYDYTSSPNIRFHLKIYNLDGVEQETFEYSVANPADAQVGDVALDPDDQEVYYSGIAFGIRKMSYPGVEPSFGDDDAQILIAMAGDTHRTMSTCGKDCSSVTTTSTTTTSTTAAPTTTTTPYPCSKVWWTSPNEGKIKQSDLDSTNITDWKTGLTTPQYIEVDTLSGHVWWTEVNKVYRANIDGSGTTLIYTLTVPVGQTRVTGPLAYDTVNEKLWIGTQGFPGDDFIIRSNSDGTSPTTVKSDVGNVIDFDIDYVAGRIYWIDRAFGGDNTKSGIASAKLDGTDLQFEFKWTFADGLIVDEANDRTIVAIDGVWVTDRPITANGTHVYTESLTEGPMAYDAGTNTVLLRHVGTTQRLDRINLTTGARETFAVGVAGEFLDVAICGTGTSVTTTSTTSTTSTTTSTTTTTPDPADCQNVYYQASGPQALHKAGFFGEDNTSLFSTSNLHLEFAIDATTSKVYWADPAGNITRTELDGTSPLVLVSGQTRPSGLAIDVANNFIYWTDSTDGDVKRCTLTGGSVTTLVSAGLDSPVSIDVDSSGGFLYITDYGTDGTDGRIMRCTLAGASLTALISSKKLPVSMELDVSGGKLYYAETGAKEVRRANLAGTADEAIWTGSGPLDTPWGVALDLTASTVWWTLPSSGGFRRANLDGTSPQLMFSVAGSGPTSIELCGDSSSAVTTTSTTTSTTTTSSSTTTSTTFSPGYCSYLYWSDLFHDEIRTVNEDGTVVQTFASSWPQTTAIVSDPDNNKLYWIDSVEKRLVKSDLDGTNLAQVKDLAGLNLVCGLSLDVAAGKLYYCDYTSGSIFRVNTDGTVPETIYTAGVSPFDTDVDAAAGKLYWTDTNSILRSNLDGTSVETFETGIGTALGLAIDPFHRRIYWVDADNHRIQRRGLDSGATLPILSGLSNPLHIALDFDNGRLLFTEPLSGLIRRADYDGTNLATLYSGGLLSYPYAIALCSSAAPNTTTTSTSTSTTTTSTTAAPTTSTTAAPTTTTSTTTTTCAPDPINVGGGRTEVSVDQAQGGTYYPFIDPSDDLDKLIADLYLSYADKFCTHVAPFKIDWLSCFGDIDVPGRPFCRCDPLGVQISDADDVVVFDTRDATLTNDVTWGVYRVVEWTNEYDEVLRVVKFVGWDPDETVVTWPEYFEPTASELDPRTHERMSPQLNSVTIETTDDDGDPETIVVNSTDGIVFEGGYNVTFDLVEQVNADGGKVIEAFAVDSTPGEGLGRFPGCEENLYLRHLNTATADDRGNVKLDASGCYRVQQPVASIVTAEGAKTFQQVQLTPNTVQLFNDCGACCSCDDFVAVYEALRKLWFKYKLLGQRAEAVRDLYAANRDRWEENRECRADTVLRCAMLPVVPCKMGVSAGICNNSDEPLTNVAVQLDFSGDSATEGCVVCDSSHRRYNIDPSSTVPPNVWQPYTLEGDFPVFTARFDCINPGQVGTVTFQLDFPGGGESDNVCVTVKPGVGLEGTPSHECCSGLKCESDEDCCEPGSTSASELTAETASVEKDSGSIDEIVLNFATGNTSIRTVGVHALSVGDSVAVTGNSVAAYNKTHIVTHIESTTSVITDVIYTATGSGGNYQEL